jgi:nitrate reductase gamma subunit
VLLLWVGQDLQYSPGWHHPMFYYFVLCLFFLTVFGITGLVLRRGFPRID